MHYLLLQIPGVSCTFGKMCVVHSCTNDMLAAADPGVQQHTVKFTHNLATNGTTRLVVRLQQTAAAAAVMMTACAVGLLYRCYK
jgi:hypothetical protein